MSSASSFRDLKIWQNGKLVVLEVYKVTTHFPQHEQFGLISQLRRAAVSVPANIAEGFSRHQQREFKRFLHIALGSCAELSTLLEVCKELGYLGINEFNFLFDKVDYESKMLMNYIKCL